MKKKVIVTLIIIIIFFVYGVYGAFYDMNRLPMGDLIAEEQSPNGTYTAKAYLTYSIPKDSYAIRGELNFNNSKKRAKNIYWDGNEKEAMIQWVDDDTVIINGIELNVPDEKFDYRRKK